MSEDREQQVFFDGVAFGVLVTLSAVCAIGLYVALLHYGTRAVAYWLGGY